MLFVGEKKKQIYIYSIASNELEKERKRIARDLHDSVAQDIRAVIAICELEFKNEKVLELQRKAISEIRNICYNLNPSGLGESDLKILLQELCSNFEKQTGTECRFYFSNELDFSRMHVSQKINIF